MRSSEDTLLPHFKVRIVTIINKNRRKCDRSYAETGFLKENTSFQE
ncbi:MAG: hypothetical protein ABI180_18165 [Microcoleus sp.]